MKEKKIKVIATGGTISAIGKNELDLKDYMSGKLSGQQLIDNLPEIADVEITVKQLENFSSTLIGETHWLQLRDLIHVYLNEQHYDGIVITHGTNTLEETAYFLHLTVASNKPIVLVGSQRPFFSLSSDGPLNLYNAIRVAASNNAKGKGVLVVANDEINSARDVTKSDTYRLETFRSGQLGFLGYVDPDNTVQFYRNPLRKHTVNSIFSSLEINNLPRVEIVYSYAGADGEIIKSITDSNKVAGIVIAGTGAGRFSKKEELALNYAVENGITVVRSSRVGNGRVVDIDYYKNNQFVTADNLLPQKARILLMLSLIIEQDYKRISRLFTQY